MKEQLKDDIGILKFWVDQSPVFPTLSAAAFPILAIPLSSIARKRNFSIENRIVTPPRNRTNSAVLEDMAFIPSFDTSSE